MSISRSRAWRGRVFAALAIALSACDDPLPIERFADQPPVFDPITFFTGATHSWGVFENRSGAPTRSFVTDASGVAEPGGLLLTQRFTFADGHQEQRVWHLRQTDAHHYEATANDVVGIGRGDAYGRAFHWRYTLATKPGSSLYDVDLDQWMYLMQDGTMMNRATIRKLGVIVAEVTEHFRRGD